MRFVSEWTALLALTLALFSCKEPEEPYQKPIDEKPQEESTTISVWGKNSGYRIVYNPAEDDKLAEACARDIAAAAKEASGVTLPVTAAGAGLPAGDLVVSVGQISQEDVQRYLSGV